MLQEILIPVEVYKNVGFAESAVVAGDVVATGFVLSVASALASAEGAAVGLSLATGAGVVVGVEPDELC